MAALARVVRASLMTCSFHCPLRSKLKPAVHPSVPNRSMALAPDDLKSMMSVNLKGTSILSLVLRLSSTVCHWRNPCPRRISTRFSSIR